MKKKNYQHIKCLPCPNWVTSTWITREELLACFIKKGVIQKIEPTFNRNGYYYDRKTKLTWIEIDGEAFKYDTEMFLYEFKLANHKQLTQNERNAIKTLIKYGSCPQKLKEMYFTDSEIIHLREISLDAQKSYIQFAKNNPQFFARKSLTSSEV